MPRVKSKLVGSRSVARKLLKLWVSRKYKFGDSRAFRKEVLRMFPRRMVRFGEGAYRFVVIFPQFVVKLPKDAGANLRIRQEHQFTKKMRKTSWRRHFTETDMVEIPGIVCRKWRALIQETLPSGSIMDIEEANGDNRTTSILQSLAAPLGDLLQVDDVHEGNTAIRIDPKDKIPYPVFIDCEMIVSKPPKISLRRPRKASRIKTATFSHARGTYSSSGF